MTITPITFILHREGMATPIAWASSILTADPEHAHLRIEHDGETARCMFCYADDAPVHITVAKPSDRMLDRIAAEVLAAVYRARQAADGVEEPAFTIVTRAAASAPTL